MWGHHHNNPWYFEYFEETKDIDISKFLEESKNHSQQKENTQYTNPNVFKPFNEFDWVREKFNYANRVAEHFGVPLINESIFGGSINRLYRKTLNYIINTNKEELKDTLFLLEIPPIGRSEMYFLNQERYCNFVSNDDNFDFIEEDNFKYTREFYKKSFDIQISAKDELVKLYTLLELFKLYNAKYVFIQSDNRASLIQQTDNKYINYNECSKIQERIDDKSVRFYSTDKNDYNIDVVSWIRNEKCTFGDDTNGLSFDGHNSINGSKKIAEQIINYINNL
jgi:hypothetical protein